MKIGLFYGSTLGGAKSVAEKISSQIEIDIYDVSNGIEDIEKYDNLIFGTNTWGYGELQDDWSNVKNNLEKIDFTKKKIAIYSTGDQESYSSTFVDAIGILGEIVETKGGKLVGFTDIIDYQFEESISIRNNQFCGLAIDDNNQSSKTEDRIKNWIETLKKEF